MFVHYFQITGFQRLTQLDIVVRNVLVVIALIDYQFPILSIYRMINTILMIQVHRLIMLYGSMLVIVQLDRTYLFQSL